jgi:hypothetical protein
MSLIIRYITAVFVLVFHAYAVFAQDVNRQIALQEFVESMTEELEEENDQAAWLEELYHLFENPVDINLATLEELLRNPFLDEITAGNILDYRTRTGRFLTVHELTSVPGISRETARNLSLFVVAGDQSGVSGDRGAYLSQISQQLLMRGWQSFPKSKGYRTVGDKPPAYKGEPQKIYTRYLLQKGQTIQAGLTGDKDPGEQFFKGVNRYGFDFYSAHLSFRVSRRLPQVIAGDYTIRAGQGLILWQGFSMGKTAEVLKVSKSMTQMKPYTSSDENFFFRGTAIMLHTGNLKTYIFASRKKSDANRIWHDDGSITISSLQRSGYHRTNSEIEDKNSTGHTVAGTVLNFSKGKMKLGLNSLYEHFQHPLLRGGQLYQEFLLKGTENYNASLDYRRVSGKFQLFGEVAVAKSGGIAVLQGLDARLHDQVQLALLFRHYGKRYHATWGNGFGENSSVNNETGFYSGIRILPASRISLSAYSDWFGSEWITYTTAGPARGREYFVQADLKYSRRVYGYVRYKGKTKPERLKSEKYYTDQIMRRDNLRFHMSFRPVGNFVFSTRFESAWHSHTDREHGKLIYQEIGYTPARPLISATARLAWFSTDSYSSRIYAYESDLLYNFSTLAFSGEGIRAYLNIRCRFSDNLDGWLKLARTSYADRDVISSGYNEILGNSKTEVKIQVRYRL